MLQDGPRPEYLHDGVRQEVGEHGKIEAGEAEEGIEGEGHERVAQIDEPHPAVLVDPLARNPLDQ